MTMTPAEFKSSPATLSGILTTDECLSIFANFIGRDDEKWPMPSQLSASKEPRTR